MGIPMGAPFFKYKDLFKKEKVVVRSSNYALYGDISRRVMSMLREYSPRVEIYSVDEAFLDLDGMHDQQRLTFAGELREKILKWTGIPVSIGISQTKTLSKLANKVAKKETECGYFIMQEAREINPVLARTAIGDVWGIGRKWSAFLSLYNIDTALAFILAKDAWVQKHMGIVGVRMLQELRGKSCGSITEIARGRKRIASTRSFGRKISDFEELKKATAYHAARVGERLRRQDSSAYCLTVFITTDYLNKYIEQYRNSYTHTFYVPTDNTALLIDAALKSLMQIFKPGYLYKKSGVIVSEILPARPIQQDFFEPVDLPRSRNLMAAIDSINRCYEKDTVRFAAQGYSERWTPRSEQRSPNYTTSWDQLLRV